MLFHRNALVSLVQKNNRWVAIAYLNPEIAVKTLPCLDEQEAIASIRSIVDTLDLKQVFDRKTD